MSKTDFSQRLHSETLHSNTQSSTIRTICRQKSSFISGYRKRLNPFNGPYIDSVPQISVYQRGDNTHGILLATDGLWDELKKPQIAEVFHRNYKNEENFLRDLLDTSISTAAMKKLIKKDELETMAVGVRRDFHDDISIVFVPLD